MDFEYSLKYIDDPKIAFGHEKADGFFLSSTTDYEKAQSELRNKDSFILPLYVPERILKLASETDFELAKKLLVDYRLYTNAKKDIFSEKLAEDVRGYLILYAASPDASYELKLWNQKMTIVLFAYDDQGEKISAAGGERAALLLASLLENMTNQLKRDLKAVQPLVVDSDDVSLLEDISLLIKLQKELLNLMDELDLLAGPKCAKLFRNCMLLFFETYKHEMGQWTKQMKRLKQGTNFRALSLEERTNAKFVTTFVELFYLAMLTESETEYYDLEISYQHLANSYGCTHNDAFSFFNEEFGKKCFNPYNLVTYYMDQGMNLKEAFKACVYKRNELMKACELVFESSPSSQRSALLKVLYANFWDVHVEFTSTRYGWRPKRV